MVDNAQTRSRFRIRATEGEWWRFSLYEIRDGCIRPAKGAKLEWYDPWPDFQRTRAQTVGQAPAAAQPGYQSLMKLVHQLEYLPGQRYPDCLTQKSQALILEWCQQHGLLGVLLSRWESISLAPQHDEADQWAQRRYFRGFGQVVQVQETRRQILNPELHSSSNVLDRNWDWIQSEAAHQRVGRQGRRKVVISRVSSSGICSGKKWPVGMALPRAWTARSCHVCKTL